MADARTLPSWSAVWGSSYRVSQQQSNGNRAPNEVQKTTVHQFEHCDFAYFQCQWCHLRKVAARHPRARDPNYIIFAAASKADFVCLDWVTFRYQSLSVSLPMYWRNRMIWSLCRKSTYNDGLHSRCMSHTSHKTDRMRTVTVQTLVECLL